MFYRLFQEPAKYTALIQVCVLGWNYISISNDIDIVVILN